MNTINDFSKLKYGTFIHFVTDLSIFSDGRKPSNVDEAVNSFDVEGFADTIEKMKVQYAILTSWHYNMIPLYPSEVTDRWRAKRSPRRDLLGEMIDALAARNIKVILYTHPRDGHDFSDEDRELTGWGKGHKDNDLSAPSPDTFDYKKWNLYIKELYTELAERYAPRLFGFYTDGAGPYKGKKPRFEENMQVVDYLMIRDIMKSHNPALIMIQNYFGYIFSNDHAMPEGYFGYEESVSFDSDLVPAAKKALALCSFKDGWFPQSVSADERDILLATDEDMARLTIFNASCTSGGGTVWACGPYAEGNVWQNGVPSQMERVGRILSKYRESALDCRVGLAYPTVSGDTLMEKGYIFSTSSPDGEFEYLHLMMKEPTYTIKLGETADASLLSSPCSLTEGLSVTDFQKTDTGYKLTLDGKWNKVDNVIKLKRTPSIQAIQAHWINDTDKRIRYEGEWTYCHLTRESRESLGCFESDLHRAKAKGASLFLAFEGSFAEIFAHTHPEGGCAELYVDGIKIADLNTKGDSSKGRVPIFKTADLYGGWHTVYIVLTENSVFDIDAIKIYD
ncbi:MAG: hypothetical protein E7641_00450 [Ruminococcaceae bacterium]|nr:hypothetical protein [Oscillospiraceae bacterium]